MNADEFSKEIGSRAPTIDRLLGLGLNVVEAERFRESYIVPRRSISPEIDPLLDLCKNFDLSTLEIGMIRFNKPIQINPGMIQVGAFEADPLVLCADQSVRALDHEVLNRELCKCALDSERFLRSLLRLVDYNRACFDTSDLADDSAFLKSALRECVAIAGPETESFFISMLGGE